MSEMILEIADGTDIELTLPVPFDMTLDQGRGPQGNPGPKGDIGDEGPKGDTGDTGPKGDKGDTGDAGIDGPKGDTGDSGADGPKGDTGDQGPKGDTGADGDQGPKGDTGDEGPKGDTGDEGPKGDTGDEGPAGDDGQDANAWFTGVGVLPDEAGADGDFYLDNSSGNIYQKISGTWGSPIANIMGPEGEDGAKGDTGDPGTDGATGDTGPKGDTGDQGVDGDPGPGLAAGGTIGQVSAKASSTDYDTEWVERVNWAGDWEAGTYPPQSIVRREGYLFLSTIETSETPSYPEIDYAEDFATVPTSPQWSFALDGGSTTHAAGSDVSTDVVDDAHVPDDCMKIGGTSGLFTKHSSAILTLNFPTGGSISFLDAHKAATDDRGVFYIDSVAQYGNSNIVWDWTERSFDVGAGVHTFEWRYNYNPPSQTAPNTYAVAELSTIGSSIGTDDWVPLAPVTSGVESLVAGDNVSIDSSDPANPIVSATGGSATELADLIDVDFTTDAPTDGQALTYDDASDKWIPRDGVGADGDSAYQVALNNGFSGTEEEWLASLVGPQGDTGTAGDDGVVQSIVEGTGVTVDSTDPANPIVSSPLAASAEAYTDNAVAKQSEALVFALGDETTAITTGTKVTFRMPFAMTLTAVRASLTTASSSGNPAVNVKESGTTIFSTTLTIDATEKTSTTAATAAVISDASLADDAEMTIIVDTAGTGAAGLKVTLIGTRA